uniref:Uncharacterized protein n=1 Tax=Schizaphis graminum TaxID=13262 RepID=A0A2S2P087_SCHGA
MEKYYYDNTVTKLIYFYLLKQKCKSNKSNNKIGIGIPVAIPVPNLKNFNKSNSNNAIARHGKKCKHEGIVYSYFVLFVYCIAKLYCNLPILFRFLIVSCLATYLKKKTMLI